MATPHVIASSSGHTSSQSATSNGIVGTHFRVGKKIGEGSFGVVFEGTNILNSQPVAIKFEPRKSEAPQLRDEYRSYRTLNGTPGVPQVHYFGQEGLHNVLVIDLLGPNLEDLFDMCGRKFTIKTVCMAAKQMWRGSDSCTREPYSSSVTPTSCCVISLCNALKTSEDPVVFRQTATLAYSKH
ncbi:Palmitoylated plasma membrane-bound casein kinase [Steccherinum ochraceum]|uniref:non-specific serine/threonine protein kinase n=1 Tax=Steccherinum ochraceum TaxID=92696 RepID=A0A4R0R498_9APHY|nr:Palmitoylated plasma membrane-bound casein kinase [Steccherinum ochraceum]